MKQKNGWFFYIVVKDMIGQTKTKRLVYIDLAGDSCSKKNYTIIA
jgi:hypothetical protein